MVPAGVTEQEKNRVRSMAMDGLRMYSPTGAMSTATLKRAFGFLVAASLLSVLAPLCSRLPSVSDDVVVFFNVDRGALFFFCNALLLFLARDSGFLDFLAPANAMHDESYSYPRTAAVPDGPRGAAVAEVDEKVGVVESVGSDLEFENAECSESTITSAVTSAESTTSEELSEEEEIWISSDSETERDGTDEEEEEEMESAEDLEEDDEDLEEFNRRCEEFIARMKRGKRIDHAVGVEDF